MKSTVAVAATSTVGKSEAVDGSNKPSSLLINSHSRKLALQKEEKDKKLLNQLMQINSIEQQDDDCSRTVITTPF